MKTKPNPKNKTVKKQNHKQLLWSLKVLIISFALSMCFGVLSEFFLSGTGVIISVLIIIVFMSISILTDMIGVAVTAADIQPFRAMASKKIRGAKEAIKLIKNADKFTSIIADVVGDVCGILSGAAGASIIVKIAIDSESALGIIIASLVSAIIASLTIFGKSLGKKYAMKNCNKIMLVVGKVMSWFTPQGKTNKKNKQEQNKDSNEQTDKLNKEQVDEDKDKDNVHNAGDNVIQAGTKNEIDDKDEKEND